MNTHLLDDAPDLTFTPVPGIPYWTQAMQRATLAERAGQLAQALIHYQLALSTVQKWLLVAGCPTPDECLSAFVSCHLCIAGLQVEAGHSDSAANSLADVHQELLTIITQHDRSSAWHQAAVWHSRDTHGALLAHLASHGHHPVIERALRAGCLALCTISPQVH